MHMFYLWPFQAILWLGLSLIATTGFSLGLADRYALIGVIAGGHGKRDTAIIRDTQNGRSLFVTQGELLKEIDGFKVVSIDRQHVILSKNGQKVTLGRHGFLAAAGADKAEYEGQNDFLLDSNDVPPPPAPPEPVQKAAAGPLNADIRTKGGSLNNPRAPAPEPVREPRAVDLHLDFDAEDGEPAYTETFY